MIEKSTTINSEEKQQWIANNDGKACEEMRKR